ncbi:MAG: IPT/TIG domain-containing protein [Candidatus Solibacter sp.]|nr:IPT/TIG domain-containing protein [Candidatus Solibacter sp.]
MTPGAAGPAPTVSAGGVVSAASFQPGIVPGSYVTIFGTNLSPVAFDTWDKGIVNGVLPTSLDGVRVDIGSKPAFVYRIFPNQIDVQAPDVGTGPVPVTVTTPGGTSVAVTANVVAQSPAFFLWPGNQVVATRNADGSWAVKDGTFAGATTVAAKPGDVLLLWGTGFGPTTPPVAAGILVPGDKIYNTSPVSVKIGTADALVIYGLLSPGYAGLYQVAIQVPASMADGDYALKATVSGASSPDGVTLSVKK